jgi:tetratricopeptide (TPR) repeat protein
VRLLGRPFAGPDAWSVATLLDTRDRLLALLAERRGRKGAVLFPFSPEEERSVVLLLGLLQAALSGGGRRSLLEGTGLRPFCGEGRPGEVAIYHHAPRLAGLEGLLQAREAEGTVALLTGLPGELEGLDLPMPHTWAEAAAPEPLPPAEAPTGSDEVRSLLPWVAAPEAWGVPLPFDLLVRTSGRDEDQAAAAVESCVGTGPLHWIEASRPAGLHVTLGGQAEARRVLRALDLEGAPLWEHLARLVSAAEAGSGPERHAVLRLLRCWQVAPGERRQLLGPAGAAREVRALARAHAPRLAQGAGETGERLAWAGTLASLGLFPEAVGLLPPAQAPAGEDTRLLHARAHALGRWALAAPGKASEAREAFQALARADDRNPYVWQAWGVLEHRLGNPGQARTLLDTAVRTAPDNVACLVARADLALDEGRFGLAGELLRRAARAEPASPFVLHLEGRLLHARGNDEGAASRFGALLAQDPWSLHARHALAALAGDAGRWDEAEEQLARALAVDPENVACLHALAEVARRRAAEFLAEGASAQAQGHLLRARQVLEEALACEPGNPRLQLGLALAALGLGRCRAAQGQDGRALFDEAEELLQRLLAERPDNLQALHALGSAAEARGDGTEAARRYEAVLERQPDNLHALFSRAELAARSGSADEASRRTAAARVALVGWRSRLPAHERRRWEERLARLERPGHTTPSPEKGGGS